jgi:RNA polymerase-binding transcription factor DksA
MDKKIIKEKLEQEKKNLEEQLKTFASKDPNLKGDWDSKYPNFGAETGSASLETEANEVEEYGSRLPVEFSLETRAKDISLALEKLDKGTFGKCEKCGQNIEEDRLEVHPAARFCLKCQS